MPRTDERVLPHNLEAERSLLGAILLDGQRLLDAAEVVTPQDFYRDAHRRIYAGMLQLSEDREPVDFITLKELLTQRGDLDEVGGPAYLTSLVDGIPRGSNVPAYAEIVRAKARIRSLIHASSRILADSYLAEKDAATLQQEAERSIFELGVAATASAGFKPMREIAHEGFEYLERANLSRDGGVSGVPSGFVDLDALTRGFQPGSLVILAARPAVGKTSLALNIAAHAAKAGLAVGMFSLEMSNAELFMRQLSGEARIDSHRMQSGWIRGHEWGRLSQAMTTIAEWRMQVDESPNVGVFEMRSRCRRLKLDGGLDVVMVDYLQLMVANERKHENRVLELATITRGLKGLAKELQVPVIVLSQLNRGSERRDDHRPKLYELRDSGAIEQDADIVIGLHRESLFNETDENRNLAELILLKHRSGPTGTVKLAWFPEETRFANFADLALPRDIEQQSLPVGDR